jgi:hypothetical protein
MASPVAFQTHLPVGDKWCQDRITVDGRIKRRIRAKGFTKNTATIIGDSVIQFLNDFLFTSIQSVPGSHARDVIQMIQQGSLTISQFSAVVLFTGTNDLCDTPYQEIANIFRSIVAYIRFKNPETRIAIAGIIPRPCNEGNTIMLEARTNTNTALAYLSKRLNVDYFKTEICLHDKGPVHQIYRPDGIHLENYGVGLLKTHLEGKLASLIGVPPQWDPILLHIIPKCPKRKKSATKSAKKMKLI